MKKTTKKTGKLVRKVKKGFTLIEILIVVIILGILAAIVIPQFTNASTAAKASSLATSGQTLRSQIAYYKLQHNDTLPTVANFWTALTTQTDATGAAYVAGTSTTGPFGPYMQSIPANNINGASTVIDAALMPGATTTGACGWEYDYNGGAGTGRVYGTGTDFLTVQP